MWFSIYSLPLLDDTFRKVKLLSLYGKVTQSETLYSLRESGTALRFWFGTTPPPQNKWGKLAHLGEQRGLKRTKQGGNKRMRDLDSANEE